MTISRAEAAESLNEADAVGRHTRRAGGYAVASPHLIMWGVIWLAGYTACGLTDPGSWGLVWLPLVLAGAVGAVLLGRRSLARGVRLGSSSARSFVLAVATAIFMLSVYAVFRPSTVEPYLVFPALVTALIYVAIGAYGLPRFGWIGCAIFVLSMASFLFAGPWLPFGIALAGGGGLALGGLWLRTI